MFKLDSPISYSRSFKCPESTAELNQSGCGRINVLNLALGLAIAAEQNGGIRTTCSNPACPFHSSEVFMALVKETGIYYS